MRRPRVAFVTLSSSALIVPLLLVSGCMGLASDDSSGFDLNVEADSQYGMILTSYEDGIQRSNSFPVITFDFSESANYGHGSSFGIVPEDGIQPIITDSVDATEITVEFTGHGLYSVTAFGLSLIHI